MGQKVLVLSLLRLGDALVHAPAMAALADQGHDVHVLLQATARPVAPLLQRRFRVQVLPRDYLGQPPGGTSKNGGTGGPWEKANPGNEAFEHVFQEIRSQAFDVVVNLTHKRYGALLAAQLGAPQVLGLAIENGVARFSSPWMHYLNEWGSAAPLSVVHYADVFCQAIGRPWTPPELPVDGADVDHWSQQRAGWGWAENLPLVFVQLSTSEGKKTYPLPLWKKALAQVATCLGDVGVVVLASPGEAAGVQAFCEDVFRMHGVRIAPYVCSIEQAYAALGDACCLVSGDTSLVHLASLRNAPTVLLSSGSSAFRELGPHGSGHAVLQARLPCAPCPHDESCLLRQGDVYPCTEVIPPDDVAQAVVSRVRREALRAPSSPLTQVFASRVDGAGFVDYDGVFGASGGDACARILRRYFLSTLPVVAAAGRSLEQGARSLTGRGDEERRALLAFCSVLEALVVRAEGRESGQLERAIAQAEDSVVLALATSGASRLREGTPQERQDALREFAGLLAFTRLAMNG